MSYQNENFRADQWDSPWTNRANPIEKISRIIIGTLAALVTVIGIVSVE
jgi:hypothetical protein